MSQQILKNRSGVIKSNAWVKITFSDRTDKTYYINHNGILDFELDSSITIKEIECSNIDTEIILEGLLTDFYKSFNNIKNNNILYLKQCDNINTSAKDNRIEVI